MNPLQPATVPLLGRHLVEASAGTGKTYTITTLFVRLVVERELEARQILVVTFTKAAAAELRDRIRTRLREAIAVLDGCTGDPVLAEVAARWSDPSRARARLAGAVADFD
ncbi:MAG: UvrD-helicase domain-containing protein, partial [Pseudomonadales bacterium]|nr:UvrD-helicase domain-containing protein [Pseudomonadales bacterium]